MKYTNEEFSVVEILVNAQIKIGTISREAGKNMIWKLKEEFIQVEQKKVKATITIKEASEILQVTKVSIHRYMNQGKLDRIRISPKNIRITMESINKLLSVEENYDFKINVDSVINK